jgi:hypothetical protein
MIHYRLGLLIAWMGALAGPLGAADFRVPAAAGDGSVIVPAGKPVKNLYAAGATVTVATKVLGDLCAAGGRVEVSASVEKDLMICGGDLAVQKPVGESLRLAGGKALLGSSIGGDLIAAGGQIHLTSKGQVAGDAALAGGDIVLEGPIKGRVWIAGGKVNLNGPLSGPVIVHYNGSLELGPLCQIRGKLECHGPSRPLISPSAVAPNMEYNVETTPDSAGPRFLNFAGVFGLLALVRLAAWLLAAWLLTQLFLKPLRAVLGVIETNPWRDLGLGLLILVGGMVGLPILFLTGVGYYTALIGGTLLMSALLLARLLAGFYLGLLLWRGLDKQNATTSIPFKWAAFGILVLHFVGLFPFLGWALSLGLSLIALGALSRLATQWVKLENHGQDPADSGPLTN